MKNRQFLINKSRISPKDEDYDESESSFSENISDSVQAHPSKKNVLP